MSKFPIWEQISNQFIFSATFPSSSIAVTLCSIIEMFQDPNAVTEPMYTGCEYG